MGVGVILGAGIYALIGKTAALGGNSVWMSFLAAAVVAGFTGIGYAELSSFIPRAGGEYHYAQRAFGRFVAFLVTWLLLVGLAIASAAVALGFAGYATAMFDTDMMVAAVCLIAATTALLIYGIRESAWVAGACTILEVIGLIVIIVIGVPHIGSVSLTEMPHGIGGVASAAALIFFAYIGFEEIVQLAEEAKNPTRTIPRALLLSIILTTGMYVLVAIAAVSVLDWRALGASDSPLADVAAAGVDGEVISTSMAVIALFSTANTVLILLLSASRLLYGMAEDGALPRELARVHKTRRTPVVATLLVAAVAAGIAIGFEDIAAVASLTNFAIFVTFLLINAAVVVLRFKEPDADRPFRAPLSIGRVPLIPILGILSVLIMMSRSSLETLGQGCALIGAGVVFWLVTGRRQN